MITINQYPSRDDICAVFTTFHPVEGFYQRVVRVREQVGFIVIVNDGGCDDNISQLNKWFEGTKEIFLYHNNRNVGIATSLNVGVSIAKQKGYRWILTLDDDSHIMPYCIERLINGLKNIKLDRPIGLIGMSWVEINEIEEVKCTENNVAYTEKRGIITSGSLFSVETYDIVGPFREEFYIDSVDYDYCLRARDKGFAVIKLHEIGFGHSLGRSKILNIMGFKIIVENHDAFRIYYGFRNLTVLAVEYLLKDPLYSFAVLIRHIKILSLILLFEVNKKEKIKNVVRGLRDGVARNLGKRI